MKAATPHQEIMTEMSKISLGAQQEGVHHQGTEITTGTVAVIGRENVNIGTVRENVRVRETDIERDIVKEDEKRHFYIECMCRTACMKVFTDQCMFPNV